MSEVDGDFLPCAAHDEVGEGDDSGFLAAGRRDEVDVALSAGRGAEAEGDRGRTGQARADAAGIRLG